MARVRTATAGHGGRRRSVPARRRPGPAFPGFPGGLVKRPREVTW
ncbi:hypothetical protein Sros_3491 [Streptosporangium roseum DSM 43021]|uniref:Uncharacterized protein n=1 Tax=Streptosporangium roseum (strain ATCC 12428 / DSM 43021 / JCM 3005 / KCTC 9067 / NCIMB 10171 / NRRL 2505 / NI 9100) TaxID=479432 RepID=D2BF66_STRRD|nr:hypothetical protein Sros_3491 [Streptosporangium roseum DSM 43021]